MGNVAWGARGGRGRTLLDDDEVQHAEVGVDDAAVDGLATALARPAHAVTGVALGEEEADTPSRQHALLHREALLVVTPRDPHHVTLQTRTRHTHCYWQSWS